MLTTIISAPHLKCRIQRSKQASACFEKQGHFPSSADSITSVQSCFSPVSG
jgi:hypothetical protein